MNSLKREVEDLANRLHTSNGLNDQLRGDNVRYREQVTHLETTLAEQQKQNKEKFELLEQARASLKVEFNNLANEIFEDKQRTFREQNQVQLDGLLKPLNERIKDFLLLEEEFVVNQERLKPQEEKNQVKWT